MIRYAVLLPSILLDDDKKSYWQKTIDWQCFDIIDEVSYTWNTEDCRQWLIDHDQYSPYIICIPVELV